MASSPSLAAEAALDAVALNTRLVVKRANDAVPGGGAGVAEGGRDEEPAGAAAEEPSGPENPESELSEEVDEDSVFSV